MSWDSLRIFLAIMRSGSLRQAAESLGISHPTLRRRLEAFEEQLGLRLFERRTDGLHATSEASALFEKAKQVEESVTAFGRCASSIDPILKGDIRITAPDLLVSDLLVDALADFSRKWPQIHLHIDTTYDFADLGNREADIAIRLLPLGLQPTEELIGRQVATAAVAIYGSEHQWLGWQDAGEQSKWIRKSPYPDVPVYGALNNIYLQRAACLAGMGLAMLPCFMADARFVQRTDPETTSAIWILMHPDMRRNPRLRLFRDEMVAALEKLKPVLDGSVRQSI